jgi:hypothetical protein
VIRLGLLALVATIVLAVLLDSGAKHRGLIVEVYLDVLCALVLIALASAVRSALPASRDLHRSWARPRQPRPVRPQQLEWLERQIGDARDHGYELPTDFRPVLRSIAASALRRKHGVVLEREPDRARQLLGDRVWQLIRLDEPETKVPPGGLRAVVADLEAI